MSASWWVRRWAELDPARVAMIYADQEITYGQLDRRVDAVCCWLQSSGVEKGDRTAVLLRNCPEFIELYLACSRLGSIFVPLNFRLAPEELAYLIDNCRPRALVYSSKFEQSIETSNARTRFPVPATAEVGGMDGHGDVSEYATEVAAYEGRKPSVTSSAGSGYVEEPQVIMYTSGTTGRPKGAVLSHRKTFFNCLNAETFFDLSSRDVMLIVTPLFHSGALFIQASPCLYKGATMVIHESFDPGRAYGDIERYGVTKFQAVPTIYRALLDIEPGRRSDVSTLQICAVGGEPVSAGLIEACLSAGFPMRQIMGQTETSILLWATEQELLTRPGTLGRPVFHAEVDLHDNEGMPVGPERTGEIVVRGSITMSEYWMDPVRTEQIMRGGWLRTGDLARRDEDGYYFMVDRAKDMYISGGENVYPAEVERVIAQHAQVEDVAVVGCSDARWGEVGHAFVILQTGAAVTSEDILRILSRETGRVQVACASDVLHGPAADRHRQSAEIPAQTACGQGGIC